MNMENPIAEVLQVGSNSKGRFAYIISLQDRDVRVRADFYCVKPNGVLSLGMFQQDDFIAYAPGSWRGIVREDAEITFLRS